MTSRHITTCYIIGDLEKQLATGLDIDWSLTANGFTQDSNKKNNHTSMNNSVHRALPISNPQLAAHNSIPHIKLQISRPLKALDNILLIKCS